MEMNQIIQSNQIIESLFARKSVRAFTEQEIPEEIVQVILQASTQAPTAGNQQLYTIHYELTGRPSDHKKEDTNV